MPGLNGIDAARILRKSVPSGKIVFLTMHEDVSLVEEAFRVGASGFVLKMCDARELVNAIQSVARGATYITPSLGGQLISTLTTIGPRETPHNTVLTPRQREVLQLIAEGKTMREAAYLLGISIRTTETHKYEIMRQLGADSTAALIRYAIRMNLVGDPPAAGSKE
jgi:DNA-binding NarL/FixJ family response regulator